MRKRSMRQISEARSMLTKVSDRTRASNIEPGFDYAAAILELATFYSHVQIAEACGYASGSMIHGIASGKKIPSHPAGERLYILYCETFPESKPPVKTFSIENP